ncbi:MAG: type II toxin-antitoxin system prevent-host-death family antitoxin [Acetobacteraceae bacterium]|nr:type II toxin-antitoxin system prevent-host-death family antitoxin [Acetobacteraceae bacterium]
MGTSITRPTAFSRPSREASMPADSDDTLIDISGRATHPGAHSSGGPAVPNTWQAAEARNRFSEIVDAAVDGEAQFVRRRDGKEVVVVSRDYFEKTRPTLKSFLLTESFGEDGDDAFDEAMRAIRREGSLFMISGGDDPAG